MEYGCIGFPLGHSYSEEIHRLIGGYRYELKPLTEEELPAFLNAGEFRGINVTIPYKQAVIPFLSGISDRAKRIGAVNTVVNRNGKLYGDNTGCAGLSALLPRAGIDPCGKKVLILGTGGTAKTAHAVCDSLGARQILRVSRTGKDGALTYEEAVGSHADAEILINTTPCGMYPDTAPAPISLDGFSRLTGVADVIYNPLRTTLRLKAEERGIPSAGGLYMLVAQAVAAASLFFPDRPPADPEAVYRALLREKENLVFIGMPSSGKTTVGRKCAKLAGRKFLDADRLFSDTLGITPADFIRRYGEEAFREEETKILLRVSEERGAVISVGGGAVLRRQNVEALKKNGTLIFLDRPLSLLKATPNRPLSGDPEKLAALFALRRPIYQHAADLTVDASGDLYAVVGKIREAGLL